MGKRCTASADFEGDEPPYAGEVLFAGETWAAVSRAPVKEGERLTVTGRDGLTLTVR